MAEIEFLNKKQIKEIFRNKKREIPVNVKIAKFKNKIYAYTGNLNTQQILNLSRIAKIENIGIFLFEIK